MRLLPWIDRETPKAPRLVGLQVSMTWLEWRASWAKWRRRLRGGKKILNR